MMLDLTIDRLSLNIENASGHEHRIRPITTRAMSLLAERLVDHPAAGGPAPRERSVEGLSIPPIDVYLHGMSDEQAARSIADAVIAALAVKLGL